MKKHISKTISFLLVSLLILSLFIGCSSSKTDTTENKEKTFTIDELAKYNGTNGQPAYIAVDGVVYDVTNNFPNGDHHGCKAGTDSTESIKKISHGSDILKDVPVVGKLAK